MLLSNADKALIKNWWHFGGKLEKGRTGHYWKRFGKQEAPTEGTRSADWSMGVLERTWLLCHCEYEQVGLLCHDDQTRYTPDIHRDGSDRE